MFKIALDIAYLTYLSDAYASHFLTAFESTSRFFSTLNRLWLGAALLFIQFSSRSAGGIAFFAAMVFLLAPLASMSGMDAERTRDTLSLAVVAIVVAQLVSTVAIKPRVKVSLVRNSEEHLLFISAC